MKKTSVIVFLLFFSVNLAFAEQTNNQVDIVNSPPPPPPHSSHSIDQSYIQSLISKINSLIAKLKTALSKKPSAKFPDVEEIELDPNPPAPIKKITSPIYQTLPIDTGGPPVRKEPVCNTNSDCVLVNVGCCGCASGGEAIAVHKLQKDAHNKALSARCGNPAERICTGWYRCSSYEVQCQNSQCVAVAKTTEQKIKNPPSPPPAPITTLPIYQLSDPLKPPAPTECERGWKSHNPYEEDGGAYKRVKVGKGVWSWRRTCQPPRTYGSGTPRMQKYHGCKESTHWYMCAAKFLSFYAYWSEKAGKSYLDEQTGYWRRSGGWKIGKCNEWEVVKRACSPDATRKITEIKPEMKKIRIKNPPSPPPAPIKKITSPIYQTLPIDTGGPPVRKEPVCNTNSDCVLVNVGCCGCASGGEAIAVHKLQKDAHNKALSARCGNPAERICTGWYRCSSYEVQCQNSQCVAVTSSGRR